VLQTDRTVDTYQQGLALNLRIPVAHGDGGFFMAAEGPPRIFVAAIIDDRLVEAPVARARVGADKLEADGFEDVHHEISARTIRGHHFYVRKHTGFGLTRHCR